MSVDLPLGLPLILKECIEWANIDPTMERCGVLFLLEDGMFSWLPMPNLAVRPESAFAIDTRKIVEVLGGDDIWRLSGLFHSHPSGSVDPSTSDYHMSQMLELQLEQPLKNWLYTFLDDGVAMLSSYDSKGVSRQFRGKFVV